MLPPSISKTARQISCHCSSIYSAVALVLFFSLPTLFSQELVAQVNAETASSQLAASLVVFTTQQDRQKSASIQRTDPTSTLAHQQLIEKAKQGKIDAYFVGDSITRRWGATDYPKFLSNWNKNFFGWNAANFGWGGDTTHNILWRLENGELDGLAPKVFLLQAGTNNLPWNGAAEDSKVDEIVDSIQSIIELMQKKSPESKIILTAMFPRSQNPAVAVTIGKINEKLSTLADDKQVRFLNINEKLSDSSGVLLPEMSEDGLHFNEKSYQVWADALRPLLQDILGPPAATDLAPPATGDPSAKKP